MTSFKIFLAALIAGNAIALPAINTEVRSRTSNKLLLESTNYELNLSRWIQSKYNARSAPELVPVLGMAKLSP